MSTCPICEHSNLQARSYSRNMLHKGVNITAEGLLCDYCEACNIEMTSPDQIDHNVKVIRSAFIAERERVKREQEMLTGAEIRLAREFLGITQKQASKIFGGGPTAFAKYEAEDVVQSVGMDKLIRLASEVPAAAEWLFERAGETFGKSIAEHPLHFTMQDIYNNPLAAQKTKLPSWFAEDLTTKHGQFDLRNAVFSSCNDGAYADAA
ncbi:MAG: type II TA system antitoxin MqsA family protein [Gallionellaceae bacterium]